MSGNGIFAVVAFKGLAGSKSRLSPTYTPAFRRELALAMLADVLDTLKAVTELEGVALATSDREVMCQALLSGIEVIPDPLEGGYTQAVTAAAELLRVRGQTGMLALPADIPAVTPEEVSRLLSAHRRGRAFTIVPSHDEAGSNAIVMSPPVSVPLAYGRDSFRRHVEAARREGIVATVMRLRGISLDIDTPRDCMEFLKLASATRAHACLARQDTECLAAGRNC